MARYSVERVYAHLGVFRKSLNRQVAVVDDYGPCCVAVATAAVGLLVSNGQREAVGVRAGLVEAHGIVGGGKVGHVACCAVLKPYG